MSDAPDPEAAIAEAEHAAAGNDFVIAERALRRAVALQETRLGPDHPDLANTLNNLAIVCERHGKLDEAEACYRRACAIAAAALDPGDPLVTTSRENLREFCATHGRPFDLRVLPPLPEHQAALAGEFAEEAALVPPAATSAWKPIRIALVAVAAIAAVAAPWLLRDRAVAPAPPAADRAPAPATDPDATATPAPEPAPRSAVPDADPASPPIDGADPPRTPAAAAPPVPPSAPQPAPAAPPTATTARLVESRVCRTLTTPGWQCTPAAQPADAGVFFVYSRVASPRATTVRHHWFRNGTAFRVVSLQIEANPQAGYRTYSRTTIAAERSGDWRVDIRDENGELLGQEQFSVR